MWAGGIAPGGRFCRTTLVIEGVGGEFDRRGMVLDVLGLPTDGTVDVEPV
jgi:hypothetical protein